MELEKIAQKEEQFRQGELKLTYPLLVRDNGVLRQLDRHERLAITRIRIKFSNYVRLEYVTTDDNLKAEYTNKKETCKKWYGGIDDSTWNDWELQVKADVTNIRLDNAREKLENMPQSL